MAMYVFLPAENSDLQEFIEEFDVEKWAEWQKRFRQVAGDLYLPRFSMEYEQNLNEVLKALGMEIAFDEGRADLFDMVTWWKTSQGFISVNLNIILCLR